MEREIFSLGGSAHYMMIQQQVWSRKPQSQSRIGDEAERTSPLLAGIGITHPELVLIASSSSSSSWIGQKVLPSSTPPGPPPPLPTHRRALICSKVEAQVTLGPAVMMQEVVCLIKSGH